MPKVNETWALAKSTVNYFCRLMNGAEYASLLNQLSSRVADALRIQLNSIESQNLNAESGSTSSRAIIVYNQGLEKMRQGTVASLEAAIALFDDCLRNDPAYALAYAARAEAQTRLADLKRSQGENVQNLRQQAIGNAQT